MGSYISIDEKNLILPDYWAKLDIGFFFSNLTYFKNKEVKTNPKPD